MAPVEEEPRAGASAPLDLPLGPHSKVKLMRQRLQELGLPQYGTKEMLWARTTNGEALEVEKGRAQDSLAMREIELTENPSLRTAPIMIPGVDPPSSIERAAHMLTYIPSKTWYEFCQCGKANDQPPPYLGQYEESLGPPVIAMDFGYCDTDALPYRRGKRVPVGDRHEHQGGHAAAPCPRRRGRKRSTRPS